MEFVVGFIIGAASWALGIWLGTGELFGKPDRIRRRVVRRSGRNPQRSAPDEELQELRRMAGLPHVAGATPNEDEPPTKAKP